MVKKNLSLPSKDKIKFCLVGSGKVLTSFARILLDNNFPSPILLTWKKSAHKRDIELLSGNENYENKLDILETKNINDSKVINLLKTKGVNAIFSISSRWIFRDNIIDSFNGFVFNIHAGFLPRDRGSVVCSKILNNAKKLGVTIHIITNDVDAGPIISQKTLTLKNKSPSIDLLTSKNIELSLVLLKSFVAQIIQNKNFTLIPQEIDLGIYMPQPYTEINGFIDWSWKSEHIDSFIRAFGRPMPGAMSFYETKKIVILESYVEEIDINFHPLYFGRIVNITNKGFAKVVTQNGLIVITKINFDGVDCLPSQHLRTPNILYTPSEILEKARISNNSSLSMLPPSIK